MGSFSENLKRLRIDKDLKQIDVAGHLEVSMQSYSAYENGREPNYDILVKLADFFGVSTDFLLGRTDFRNAAEEKTLKEASGGDGLSTELSLQRYRDLKSCLEKAQHFYKEKMHQYDDDGCGELFFCLNEKVKTDIELFDKLLDILMNYRDYSDRNEAVKAFLLSSDSSKLNYRVIEEILRIDREI